MITRSWIEKYAPNNAFIALDDTFDEHFPVSDDIKTKLQKYEDDYLQKLPQELHFKYIHDFRVLSSRILLRTALLEQKLEKHDKRRKAKTKAPDAE
jgi:hypothetical protein